ncbi:60S acidic ribosomal protein P2 [Tulasnella sp. 331]|nr:60S acidic ribosomal protein P2 [Tulasnella sp. 331]KAG8887550.1 60S acidic ribosomal protein P2 [Tulasnella sp. 332]
MGGKANPGASDIKKVLTAGGVDCDQELLDNLLAALEGKDINQLIAEGSSKLASVPSGGGGGGGGGGSAAPAAGGGAPAAAEEKKEEKKEEAKEESDDDMGFGLFD